MSAAGAATDETLRLFHAYKVLGDLEARDQLVKNYEPLVRRVCWRFRHARESQEDLFQVGMIGLLNAIERFDPSRGTRFSSLAIPEVMGTILNYLRDHGSFMKVSRNLRRNKLAMDKVAEALSMSLGRWPTVSEVAQVCGLSEEEAYEALEFGRTAEPRSLDQTLDTEGAEAGSTLADWVGAEEPGFQRAMDRLDLQSAMENLPPRERTILVLRFYGGLSQRKVAERVGISQMHVSRLERAALQKLRRLMQGVATAVPAGAPRVSTA